MKECARRWRRLRTTNGRPCGGDGRPLPTDGCLARDGRRLPLQGRTGGERFPALQIFSRSTGAAVQQKG